MLCIAGLCGAAGHSNRGFAQPQGGRRKAEFSRLVIRCPVGGDGQGGGNPLGCVLCLLSVASQKVGAPAARAEERKELYSPREGWAPTGDREASSRGRDVLSLFLEATQLKTVRTAIAALRADPSVAEAQGAGIATPRRNRRRPDVPGVADVIQRTVLISAEARGRDVLSLFLEATQRKTVRTVAMVLRIEPEKVEV